MMSGPLPDEIAAVMRAWRSLALIRSRVTSAPRALEASGICLSRTSSAAGTKSFQRSRWSLVPCAWAGACRAARIPSMPTVAAAAAAPDIVMNFLRFKLSASMREPPSDRIAGTECGLTFGKGDELIPSRARRCQPLTARALSEERLARGGNDTGRRDCDAIRPERQRQDHRHDADSSRADEEPGVGAVGVVHPATGPGAEPHAERRDEEHSAVGRPHDLLAEVLARDERVEGHHAAVREAEGHRGRVEAPGVACEQVSEDHDGLEREPHDERRLGAKSIGDQAAGDPPGDG